MTRVDLTLKMPSVEYLDPEGPAIDALLDRMPAMPPLVALGLAAPLVLIPARASARRIAVSQRARHIASEQLGRLSSRHLVNVDMALRSTEVVCRSPFSAPWAELTRENAARQPSDLVLDALLSMHLRGHVRGAALERLSRHGAGALPWLLLRTRDWVSVIRARAIALTRDAVPSASPDLLIDLLPLLHRLSDADLTKRFYDRLSGHTTALVARAVRFDDESLGHVFDELLARRLLTLPLCEQLLLVTSPSVRRRAARALAALHDDPAVAREARALRHALLRDPLHAVRAIALSLSARFDDDTRQALMSALLDPQRSIRWAALAALPAFDAEAFYRAHLPAHAAILGFADVAPRAAWETLVPLLDAGPTDAAVALRAMKRMARVESRELRLYMLGDARNSVSAAAYATLRAEPLDEATLEEALRSPLPHVQRNALGLALLQPEAITLRLLSGLEPKAGPSRARIEAWLERYATRHPWLPVDDRAALRALYDRLGISTLRLSRWLASMR